jgi:hypothetical protein
MYGSTSRNLSIQKAQSTKDMSPTVPLMSKMREEHWETLHTQKQHENINMFLLLLGSGYINLSTHWTPFLLVTSSHIYFENTEQRLSMGAST